MPDLSAQDIQDLITTTQRELGRGKFTLLAHDLQEFVALPRLLREKKITFGSGHGLRWNIMKQHSGAAENVGLFAERDVNVADVMTYATIDWRHTWVPYAIEDREITMNTGPAQIVELIKVRRLDALSSLAERFEEDFWNAPDVTDTVTPHGVEYWIVEDSTAGNGAFTANLPGSHTTIAGLDPATITRWRNWAAVYTNITKTDCVRRLREASVKTRFMNPNAAPDYNTGDMYGYYTSYSVLSTFEELLEAQNDNLGNDLASKDGRTLFRGNPVVWVPYLDDTTAGMPGENEPILGINWGVFKPVFLQGEYMREAPPVRPDKQHRTSVINVDNSYNFRCTDRRRLFTVHK